MRDPLIKKLVIIIVIKMIIIAIIFFVFFNKVYFSQDQKIKNNQIEQHFLNKRENNSD